MPPPAHDGTVRAPAEAGLAQRVRSLAARPERKRSDVRGRGLGGASRVPTVEENAPAPARTEAP